MRSTGVNWDEVKGRLQASEKAFQETLAPNPARVKALFRERAIRLAKGHAQSRPASSGSPALIFRLAKDRYAVELKELAEVLPFGGCTEVPGTARHFLGVVNLRGELRSVIDLGMVLSGKPGGGAGFILILNRQFGLKVDEIEGLREIRAEELTPPVPGRYTRGLVSETLTLLNVENVLSGVLSPKEF
jgi:chemotaxis signal transduction protein